MGLFKKPNRKFRQRAARADSEDEGGNVDSPENKEKKSHKLDLREKSANEIKNSTNVTVAPICTPSVSSEEKGDSSQPKASKLLSFHEDEDDGEVFKLKKSNYSRRLAKQREREKKKKEEIFTNSGFAVKPYAQEKSKIIPGENKEEKSKETMGPWDVITGNEAEDMEVDSDEEEKEKSNPFKNVLQSGVIPDAATIYAMKKHRQMAREMGDFIPVEEPEKEDENKSRLIREDDNDRSDDDEDDEPSRLNFTVNTGAVERQKIRETFLSLQEGIHEELENEDAAELDLWEREQIRKGVSVTQVGPSQTNQIADSQLYAYPATAVGDSPYAGNPEQQVLMTGLTNKVTAKDMKACLQESLSTLRALYTSHEKEMKDCQQEFLDTSDFTKKLEQDGPELAKHFSLYQQMSGYVKDLVECLDLKVAHIEMLDGNLLDLYKARAHKLITRRQQDIRDQCDEYSTLSSEILKGVSAEFLSEKNTCMDELKLRRAAEREGRRMRRRKLRERSMIIVKHHDGMSSDDEEPDIDILNFKEKRESILQEAETIFEDVVEEFGTLEGVICNFEQWKYKQPESYSEAFVPLCLPKIFGTFVRLTILDWNPLEEQRDFENMYWFQQLVQYGSHSCEENIDSQEDPDLNLLPGIVEKVILPKMTGFIQHVWDPLSSTQSRKLVNTVRLLHEKYPTINGKSKHLQTCLKAVSTRIYKSLDDDIFIPMYPKELLENRSLGASDFFQRQFWFSVKLLQNILMWEGIMAEKPLQHMALSSLLNRYLLMGLRTTVTMRNTIDKCKVIISSLPKSWFKNLKHNSTLATLKPFSSYLLKFADSYHSHCLKRGMVEDEIKDVLKDVVQMLVNMESMDDAVTLAKKYSLSAFKN